MISDEDSNNHGNNPKIKPFLFTQKFKNDVIH
jgi:hypothetical protein